MKHFAQLWSVLILGVALPGCPERTDSGAAHAYWLAHAPALPLATATAAAPASSASPPPPASLSAAQRAELSRIQAAWQHFARELCRVEEGVRPLTAAPRPDPPEAACPGVQSAHGRQLTTWWEQRDVNQLHRHILARRSWANRANAAVAKLPSAKALLRARHDFAQTACSAWPGLDDTTETCTELLELHLLAYGQYLGALSSDRAAPAAAP